MFIYGVNIIELLL